MADVPSDPRIAFVADSSAVAEAVIRLLAANDIPAEITTSAGRTTTDPLTGATELAQSDEFPIAITDPEKMEAARELLATAQAMAAVKAVRDKRANRTDRLCIGRNGDALFEREPIAFPHRDTTEVGITRSPGNSARAHTLDHIGHLADVVVGHNRWIERNEIGRAHV